jgi:hypothetical protein
MSNLTQKSNSHSHGPNSANSTTPNSSASKPKRSRDEKRRSWAKKNVPKAKPSVRKAPEREYLCECHGEPARKPAAGQKTMTKDAETGKTRNEPKGLGKWKCAQTGKTTKVTVGKFAPREAKNSAENGATIIQNFPPAPDCIVATVIPVEVKLG